MKSMVRQDWVEKDYEAVRISRIIEGKQIKEEIIKGFLNTFMSVSHHFVRPWYKSQI